MLCQNCKKNNVTVFYRENVNGRVAEYALCADCAAEMEKNGSLHLNSTLNEMERMFTEDPFESFFSGFFGRPARSLIGEAKRCPVCRSTFADLASSGRPGCPACYETFADELGRTVGQTAGAKPAGRAPKRFAEKRRLADELANVKEELRRAVEAQEFERAAVLRDRIKELEAPKPQTDAPSDNG